MHTSVRENLHDSEYSLVPILWLGLPHLATIGVAVRKAAGLLVLDPRHNGIVNNDSL